jgi:hypothetical protein
VFQAGEAWKPNVGNSPITTRLNSAVCFLAAATAVASGVSWLLTVTPWTQFISSTSYFVPFFTLMCPLFGWAVYLLASRRSGQRDRRTLSWLAEVPRWARAPLTVLGITVWAVVVR